MEILTSSDADPGAASSTTAIVSALTQAILEHRLAPGSKLAEQKLADQFGVSRTLVRQALFQLSQQRLIKLEPARGAFVAAMLVGMVDTAGRAFLPPLLREVLSPSLAADIGPAVASIGMYVLMAVVLVLKPSGLFPARA